MVRINKAGGRASAEVFWVAAGTLAAMAVALAGTRFLTTLLVPAEYGRLALMVSMAALVDQVVGHAIGGTAMRFFSICQAEFRLGELRGLIWRGWAWTALLAMFVLLAGWGLGPSDWSNLHFLTIGFALALLLSGVGVRLADAARQRWTAAGYRSAFELARFGVAAIFVYFGTATAESVMGGFFTGAAVIACMHWINIRFRLLNAESHGVDVEQHRLLVKSFRDYAAPLLIVGLGTWIFLMSPIWALGYFGRLQEVGIFSAYHQLAFVPMLVASGLLLTYIAPIVYQVSLESVDDAIGGAIRLASVTFLMVLVMAILAYLMSDVLALILLGQAFRTESWIFPWLVLAGGCFGVAQQLLLRLRVEMKVVRLAVIQLLFAGVAAIAYGIAAYEFSVPGVVFTVVIMNALLLLLSAVVGGVFVRMTKPA